LFDLISKVVAVARGSVALRSCNVVGRLTRVTGKVIVNNGGKIVIGEKVKIRGTHVPVELATFPGGELTIGDGTSINSGASICAQKSVSIGKNCGIGNYSLIMDTDFHQAGHFNKNSQAKPIVIDDDAWIAAHVVVLKGVTIGRGAVVSAGSVVVADVAPYTLVGGNPARFVRKLELPGEEEPEVGPDKEP
jgi:acetyltransferase-like isoleucine patch superfamily enzyme